MNNKDRYDEVNEDTLASLRVEEDAVRQICERVGVREMGPADHIRTKHEIKAYVEGGGESEKAAAILKSAQQRRIAQQQRSREISQREQRGQSI